MENKCEILHGGPRIITAVLLPLLMIVATGCAETLGLTEAQQEEAIRKYPRSGFNLCPDDGAGMVTAKVAVRILFVPITIGLSELVLADQRTQSFIRYKEDLEYEQEKAFYDSFLGKGRAVVIKEFGAPSRICSDGASGEIYVYERSYVTGGQVWSNGSGNVYSTPYRTHTAVKEFYFNDKGECYRWRKDNR